MRHAIDPKIDCVFKALLGAEENNNLLIHFLNAYLASELLEPLVWVDIINPYNEKEFFSDKLSIVDIKARDQHDRLYQIEIQLSNHAYLPARILYNWADIYSQQLKTGDDYQKLKPTYSIWLLTENLLTHDHNYYHLYKLQDANGQSFCDHVGILLVELAKFNDCLIENELQRWTKFFIEGKNLNDNALPDWMSTLEMKQAMSTLSTFSEKERRYDQYQARQEYLRVQRTIQFELNQTRLEKEAERQQKEAALKQAETAQQQAETAQKQVESAQKQAEVEKQRADAAIAEIAQLKSLLAAKQD